MHLNILDTLWHMYRKPADVPHLVEVEHQIKLADVAEVVIQDLHKEVDGLQVCELIICDVYTEAEVQPSVPHVNDLVGLELHAQQNSATSLPT